MSDIVIAGGGPAGSIAALAFARQGYTVTLADPAPRGTDARSTAFLAPSVRFLETLGLWDMLADVAVPLEALTLIDAVGEPPVERTRRTFQARDHDMAAFAMNVPNEALLAALDRSLADAGVRRVALGCVSVFTRTTSAEMTLSDGSRIATRLVVAADGRNSKLREAAGLGVRRHASGQIALAFTATHALPHGNVSTEIYTSGGPCTLVPVHDIGGKPASAIVWMDDSGKALARIGSSDLDAELTMRTLGVLGPMQRVSGIGQWKVETLLADEMSAERLVLIGEAAHALPPIGAQGLNASIKDISTLSGLLGPDPGADEGLQRYSRARHADLRLRGGAIDLMNRVTSSDQSLMLWLRQAGLKLASDVAPIRKGLVKAGLG
jgi:2-octaprenyl-6-methoxyphenol hydroxylase